VKSDAERSTWNVTPVPKLARLLAAEHRVAPTVRASHRSGTELSPPPAVTDPDMTAGTIGRSLERWPDSFINMTLSNLEHNSDR
jgi:hypothetical protein